jgi:hypothetical protein
MGDPLVVSRRVRIIAYSQLLVAILILPVNARAVGPALWEVRASGIWWLTAISLIALNAVAGIQTLRGKRIGFWLSVWNHVFQIPVLTVGRFTFDYMGLGGIVGHASFFDNYSYSLGVEAQIAPGFDIGFGIPPKFQGMRYDVGIDFLAVTFLVILLSVLLKKEPYSYRPK